MSQLSNIKNVKEILARHGFTFSKKLGQNFIVNPSICPRIAELGGAGPDTGVLEIGPGLGVLTWELAARARKVVAVELDERLLPVLRETLAGFDICKSRYRFGLRLSFSHTSSQILTRSSAIQSPSVNPELYDVG